MKHEFDERQILIRGKIAVQSLVLALIMMLAAAFINDFHIFDIEKEIGFSDYMIGASCLLLGFVSCSMIIKGAYFGPFSKAKYRTILSIFTLLCILELVLMSFDLLRGEQPTFVSACSILMITSITCSLWYLRKEWQ